MIVVDTTILVYAVGEDHPLRGPCRHLVDRVAAGSVAATTTVEVIQEFTHVRTRRRDRRDAVSLALSYRDLFAPLLVVDGRVLTAGLELFEGSDRLGAFDAVLAASAIGAGATALCSADAAFARIAGLRWVDPGDPDFADELARA